MKFLLCTNILTNLVPTSCISSDHPSTSDTFVIQWKNCSSPSSSLECGTLNVPLDWSHPNENKITLALARVPSTSSKAHNRSLFISPGGPGVAAIPLCEAQSSGSLLFSKALTANFNIVCADPRGVGASTPVKCDPDLWNSRTTMFPSDEKSFQRMVAQNKALGESCLNLTGSLLGHIDTVSAAKDMEAMRLALHQTKLNYMGFSYGSQLGAAYVELFPQNVRAMVLDGIVDHSQSEISNLVNEMSTYGNSLNRFFDWCSSNTSWVLSGQNIAHIFDELVEKSAREPIPAPGCVSSGICKPVVTSEDIIFNVQSMLEFRNPVPALGNPGWEALAIALIAVRCLDWTHSPGSFTQNKYKEQLGLALAPHTHGESQSYRYQASRIGWPIRHDDPPRVLDRKKLERLEMGSVMLVNAIHDVATSYVWAQNLLAQFPDDKGIELLTREGDGHTSYFSGGEARELIDKFIVHGTLVEVNTVVTS